MAIKTLGSAQKIRVGRESGNATFIILGLIRNYFSLQSIIVKDNKGRQTFLNLMNQP